jgi:hypothetical protein
MKCCLRAALSSAVLELPAKGSRAPRAACGYSALVQHFTARRYSAAAGDALRRGSRLWQQFHVPLYNLITAQKKCYYLSQFLPFITFYGGHMYDISS